MRPEFRETPELGPGSDDLLERQADRFAAAFLVPLPLLEDEILRVFEDCRIDKVKCTWELMQPSVESEWMWRTLLLPMITRRFSVSLSTAITLAPWTRPVGGRSNSKKVSSSTPLTMPADRV